MSLSLAKLLAVTSALQALMHAADSQVRVFHHTRVRISACAVSHMKAAATPFDTVQRLETAETTFPLPLTADTATQEHGDPATLSPVMTTLVYPTSGQSAIA